MMGRSVLRIENLGTDIQGKSFLTRVSFQAVSGQMLAILGPSGSGKTTLLNTVAGRQPVTTGDITLSGQPLNKQLRRRLAYVLQSDVFLCNLTLWETLYFCAMIRLPETMGHTAKIARINDIIDVLDLRKCCNTVVGDVLSRGLSGGEKKRLNIACELLVDHDILLLDEPTSGLDSSTALNLIHQIQRYVVTSNKIVVLSIHQPSSQIYMMFDSLLLLASGKVVYFGPGRESPLNYFERLGYSCQPHVNPADFLLAILKSDNNFISQLVSTEGSTEQFPMEEIRESGSVQLMRKVSKCPPGLEPSLSSHLCYGTDGKTTSFATFATSDSISCATWSRWPTGFWTQFHMLTWRNFKQSRGKILHLYYVVHYTVVTVVTAMLFYQFPKVAGVFRDVMGMFYFCVTFWTFNAATSAVVMFSAERPVVTKERAAGAYRLSAYFLAKNVSELPLYVIAPTAFYSAIYWMSGLGDVTAFLSSWPILLLCVFNAHGLGLLIGAMFTDIKLAIITINSTIQISLLFSGFITQTLPSWLLWGRYLSVIQYPLSAMCKIVIGDLDPIPCNATGALSYDKCLLNPNEEITGRDVLTEAGITLPVYCYVTIMVIFFFIVRVGAYLALRILNKMRS